MNIGVCVPLNPSPNRSPSNGPVRYVMDEAAERAEQALRAAALDHEGDEAGST